MIKTLPYEDKYRDEVIQMLSQSRLFRQRNNGQKLNPPSKEAIINIIEKNTQSDDNKIRLLIIDSQVAGMATLEVTQSIYNPEVFIGKLSNLYLLENFRGKGLSKGFISDMENEMRSRGCKWVKLSVGNNNENAYRIYKKFGYNDDTIGMIKTL